MHTDTTPTADVTTTADTLAARLRAAGFAPGLSPHITEATVRTDTATCRRMICPGCGRRAMTFRPFRRGRSYRALAACGRCPCAKEV